MYTKQKFRSHLQKSTFRYVLIEIWSKSILIEYQVFKGFDQFINYNFWYLLLISFCIVKYTKQMGTFYDVFMLTVYNCYYI